MRQATKYHYHAIHKIRCRVRYNKSEGVIELTIQRYRNWFIGWVNYNTRVDIELGECPESEWRMHPIIMHYQIGGCREIWDRARFDLGDRIESLLSKYATMLDRQRENENYIKKHIMTLQEQLDELRMHQTALSDKLLALEHRLNDTNPAMDRQEYPQGMSEAKEWEIVEFRVPTDTNVSRSWRLRADGYYYPGGEDIKHGSPCVIEQMMKLMADGKYCIWSVRRLSDNTVWTVGDREVGGVIQGFKIVNNVMFADGIGTSPIALWRKAHDWEIVEFRSTQKTPGLRRGYTRRKDGKYMHPEYEGDAGVHSEIDLLTGSGKTVGSVTDGSYIIHSVRRLSDGEVFTVGDKATMTGKENCPEIKSFEIVGGKMCAIFFDIAYDIYMLIKVESFTTADGVEVLEGYNIWFMHPESGPVPTHCKAIKGLRWENHYSTKEAAEAAYKAAVLFTTADGVDVFTGCKVYMYQQNGNICYDTAKEGSGGLWYSTRAAAEAAYEKWLYDQPVLTFNDLDFKGIKGAYRDELKQLIKDRISKA